MISTFNNNLESLLVDTENTQLVMSEASRKMNEPTFIKRSMHTIGEMENRKFRRLFNRHRIAYQFFN